jgi:hypothetical protein
VSNACGYRLLLKLCEQCMWILQTKLTIRQKALPYTGATLYNSLPLEIRQSTTLNTFKIRAYKHFLDIIIM